MAGSEPPSDWRANLLSDSHGVAVVAIRDGRVCEANRAAHELFEDLALGVDARDLFDESSHAKLLDLLRCDVPCASELGVRRHDAPIVNSFVLVASAPEERLLIAGGGGIGYTEAIAAKLLTANTDLGRLTRELARRVHELDTARRALAEAKAKEERLRAELEELSRATTLVAEAVADLSQPDVSAVLHTIALQARALTQADYVSIGLGADPEESFHPWVFLGIEPEIARRIGAHPRPVGTLGAVARDGEVIRTPDMRRHAKFLGFPPHHPDMRSFLAVPIHHRGRPMGNLYLANKPDGREFTESDERVIRLLAARVGVAIETALLYTNANTERRWLQSVIDQMPEGIVLYDERGRVKAVSRALSAKHSEPGTSAKEFVLDIRAPDGSVIPQDALPMARAQRLQEMTLRRELLLRQPNGSMVPVSVSAVPIRDASGKMSGVTVIVEDLSERKELERLREEWAAIVAHDLRQPIGTISLGSECLLRAYAKDLPENGLRTLTRIREASQQLARMINDLTDLSLIESARLPVNAKPTDVREIVASVVEQLEGEAPGVEVRVNVEGAPPIASIDRGRIQQVLSNLVSNAVKYGAPNAEIRIDVVSRDAIVEVSVTNRGAGIAPEQLASLFGRFQRTRDARASGLPGLGLGLYISKGLVEAHGGRIWAESIPGKSTTFRFTLPRIPAAA